MTPVTRHATATALLVLAFLPFACGGQSEKTLPARTPLEACEQTSDCVLSRTSCCGQCGAPTLDDVHAVHRDHADDYYRKVCPAPLPCPECESWTNPSLVTTCNAGTCQAVDIAKEAITACNVDDDCRVRTRDCCECGGSQAAGNLIAVNVNVEAAYSSLVCDEGWGCTDYAPVYPGTVFPVCSAGHCVLVGEQ